MKELLHLQYLMLCLEMAKGRGYLYLGGWKNRLREVTAQGGQKRDLPSGSSISYLHLT